MVGGVRNCVAIENVADAMLEFMRDVVVSTKTQIWFLPGLEFVRRMIIVTSFRNADRRMKRKNRKIVAQNRWDLIGFLLFGLLVPGGFAFAQDDASSEAKPKIPNVEMLECRVKVVDPDGFPVEEATVYCTGLRSKEQPGSAHLMDWLMRIRVKTDKDGIAKMPYPKLIRKGLTTNKLTWSVEHPDFTSYRQGHSVDEDPAELQLERGFRIALTAQKSSGEKITENLYAIGSFAGGGKWELKTNGMLVSNTMKTQDGVLRVVCFEPNRPTLFSDEIEIKPGDKSRILLQNVQLSPGCRVEGKLADSVKRPIENGYVIASVDKAPTATDRGAIWNWSDEAKIERDGTFVFESLPRDEVVQMIPICDGWVPAKPKPEDLIGLLPAGNDPKMLANVINNFAATPQLVKAEGDVVKKTLEMVKGPTLTIEVVDSDGKPIEGVSMGTSPNQYWFNFGSQVLGESFSTREAWERRSRGEDVRAYYLSKPTPYSNKTDKNGRVIFKSMPQGTHEFYVGKKGLELAKSTENGNGNSMAVTINDDNKKLKIAMSPKQE